MPGAAASWRLDVSNFGKLARRLEMLGETDAPRMNRVMVDGAQLLAGAIRASGGSVARNVQVGDVRGKGARVRVRIAVLHGRAKVQEFGRSKWYRSRTPGQPSGIGNNRDGQRRGHGAFKAKGASYRRASIRPRPYVGIVNSDHAVGFVAPRFRQMVEQALRETWDEAVQGLDRA